jgi:hypothetical protein
MSNYSFLLYSDALEWNDFNDFPVFFQKEYAKFITQIGGNLFYVYHAVDEDVFIPFFIEKSKFLKTIRILYKPIGKYTLTDNEEHCIMEHFIKICKKKRLAHKITFYIPFSVYPYFPKNSIYCKTGHFEIGLENISVNSVMETLFKSKTRNMVRKAEKEGVYIRYGNQYFNDFYRVYKDTNIRTGAYCESYDYLSSLNEKLEEFCIPFVAYCDNTIQSSALIILDNQEAYYLYAGSAAKIVNGSSNLLQLKIIEMLISKGIKKYLLGGARLKNIENTKFYGIQKFKTSLGANIVEGYLWKINLSPIICKLYDVLLTIKLILARQNRNYDYIDSQR